MWEINPQKCVGLKSSKELKGAPTTITIHTAFSVFDIHTAYQIHFWFPIFYGIFFPVPSMLALLGKT